MLTTFDVRLGFISVMCQIGSARFWSVALLAIWMPALNAQFAFSSPETAAKVVVASGRVSVLRDSGLWALSPGNFVYVKQIIVTGEDGYALLQVSDGSTFEVFPNSKVTFRNNPGNLRDLLDVWLGRVKVRIQKLTGGQPNPNRITTPTAVISVRGTAFDIVVEDDDSTLVSVEEGQVVVQHAILPSSNPKLIGPGEYIRVQRDQPLAQRSVIRGAAVQQGLRAAAEALYRILLSPRTTGPIATPGPGGGGSIPSGPGTPGDTEASPPPPPPPPPPPQ